MEKNVELTPLPGMAFDTNLHFTPNPTPNPTPSPTSHPPPDPTPQPYFKPKIQYVYKIINNS